ncbi:hypothetical protein ACYZTL_02430 [Pseudomonas sp. LB3P81]
MQKSAIRPGSNFNRQGGSVFNQRRQAAIMELTLWVEQRGSGEVGGNVRGALETISKNEEFINMTLAVLMTPE